MIQLLLHGLGDYVLQSDWMALNKSKRWWPAIVHVTLYTIPFMLITSSWKALGMIWGTHLLIDRFGLAKYLIYTKNHLAPGFKYHPWVYCSVTGYCDQNNLPSGDRLLPEPHQSEYRPAFITVWLLIITDNLIHLACNWTALRWLL